MGSSISTNEAVRSTLGATAGKLYFEITWNVAPTGANTGCGVAYAGAVLGGALNSSASGGLITYGTNGNIWYNGFNTGLTLGAFALGNTTCVAIDLPNMRGYLRKGAGLWNGTAGADPASNTGGIDILAVFAANAVFAAVTANMLANPLATVNFGATAFAQTVPSGFASMNTYFAVVKQLLQASFTPQGAGRVRGLVRLIRPNCTVWINPQILIA
jgi:hypothetical protein